MINLFLYYRKYLDRLTYGYTLFYILLMINLIISHFYSFKDYIILSILILISIDDILDKIVPNYYILFLLLFNLANLNININKQDIYLVVIFLLISFIVSLNENIGMGDIKLIFSLYLLKGTYFMMYFFFILSIFLFIFSIIFLLKTKRKKARFPMVPFILFSYILTGGVI